MVKRSLPLLLATVLTCVSPLASPLTAQSSGGDAPPAPGFAARLSGTFDATIQGYAELAVPADSLSYLGLERSFRVRLRGAQSGLVCNLTFMQEGSLVPTEGSFPVVDANDLLRNEPVDDGAVIVLVGCDTRRGFQYFRSQEGSFTALRGQRDALRAQFDFLAQRHGRADSTLSTDRLRVRGGFYAVPGGGTLSPDSVANDSASGG